MRVKWQNLAPSEHGFVFGLCVLYIAEERKLQLIVGPVGLYIVFDGVEVSDAEETA